MYWVSFFSLVVIMFWCMAGVFCPKSIYDDNLLERVGLIGVFLFSLGRFNKLVEAGELTGFYLPQAVQLFGHVGLALYFTGSGYAKLLAWINRRKPKKPGGPMPLGDHVLKHVAGGRK